MTGLRVLVFGIGRSGTSWVAQILAAAPGARMVFEPDSVSAGPHSVRAVAGRGRGVVLEAGDQAPPEYERMWRAILGGEPRRRRSVAAAMSRRLYRRVPEAERRRAWAPPGEVSSWRLRAALALSRPARFGPEECLVVKTVATPFASEWLVTRFSPRALWVRRHPLDVVAGRRAMAIPDYTEEVAAALARAGRTPAWCPPIPASDLIARYAWYVGLTMSWSRAVVDRNPQVAVVAHEDLCVAPESGFAALTERLGLAWSDQAVARLREQDRPGEGWSTERVTAEQVGKWRTRLTPSEQRAAIAVLRDFPIAADYPELG